MDDRAASLIRTLALEPHPEGGRFRETYRSAHRVRTDQNQDRSALTAIDFLLAAGEWSRWHRVAHDEIWYFQDGDPLDLWWLDPELARPERRALSTIDGPGQPTAVVPARCWQAARPRGRYTLVGCIVGPGYQAEDFVLMRDHPEISARLRDRYPELVELL